MTAVEHAGAASAPGLTARELRTSGLTATGLTASEAASRAARLGTIGYRVHVDLTDFARHGTFVTATEVRFECVDPGSPLWLDLIAADVIAVRHNGIDLDPAVVCGPERLVIADPGDHNTVVVTSLHRAGTAAAGLCRTVDPADAAVYAWTQFQPFDARRMFACFDQPDLRGAITLEVTAPPGWTCLSNTSPLSAGGDRPVDSATGAPSRVEFAPTPPIPVYLLALCAGPFASVTARHGDIRLGVHARASLEAELAAAAPELFDITRHALDSFGDAFEARYPLDTCDLVFLLDQPGAMENLGCITWNDAALFRAEPSTAQRVRRALVLLHELSHQWFGDLVSPRWWDDLWLAESFADWAAVWALRSYRPLARHGGGGHAAQMAAALRADQLPSSHPVSRPVADMDAVAANFDAITYAKGACLLVQLIDLIGEDAFLACMRGYFRRFGWGAAGIDSLLEELDRHADTDVRGWAAQWLRTAGVNTVRVRRGGEEPGETGAGGTWILTQTGCPPSPPLRRHRIRIGTFAVRGGALVREGAVTVRLDAATAVVRASGAAPGVAGGVQVLLPNDGLGDYAKVRPDPESLAALLELGHTIADPGSRATLRIMLSDMVFDGDLDGPTAVGTLAAMAGTEDDDAALAQTIDQALEAAGGFTSSDRRGECGALLAARCLVLARASSIGSSRWSAAWGGVARAAWTADQIEALRDLLAAGSGDQGGDSDTRSMVPQSLRWDALTRLVALGAAGEAEVAAELARDRDPDAARSAAVARAATASPGAKARALEALLSPDAVPIGGLARLAGALWQPHQEALLVGAIGEFLDRLPSAIVGGGPARAMRLTRWCFPEFGLAPDAVDTVRRMAIDPSLPEVARTALADQAALAERRARASSASPAGPNSASRAGPSSASPACANSASCARPNSASGARPDSPSPRLSK